MLVGIIQLCVSEFEFILQYIIISRVTHHNPQSYSIMLLANILYTPLTQAAFESSTVPKPENPLTVNELARQLLPWNVTNKEIDIHLKKVSKT